LEKVYVVDTNVLLEDEHCIEKLRNGAENLVIIPEIVIEELDKLKRTDKKYLVSKAVKQIENQLDKVDILRTLDCNKHYSVDVTLLLDITEILGNYPQLILVTNDRLLRVHANLLGIAAEPYFSSNPILSESELFSGVCNELYKETNAFFYKEGIDNPYFYDGTNEVYVHNQDVWTIYPNSVSQKMLISLLLNDKLDIITVQSVAGMGKTFLSLAAAFYLTFQKKQYRKILVVRPTHILGKELGFLPGSLDEKMHPFSLPILDLVDILNETRTASDLYKKDGTLNKRKFDIIPINYLRGANIQDTFLIIDEVQNISRQELRTVLTRCCSNVKAVLLGDINQVDNPILNKYNNGLNWTLKKLRGNKNYAHLTLTGKTSRGPICETVINADL